MPWRQTIKDYLLGRQHMKRYVNTVILSEDLKRVVTIMKDHGPSNLVGKLNAIGGSIEPGESIREAAIREVKEEANLSIDKRMLIMIGNMSDINYTWDVAWFVTVMSDAELAEAKTMTSEVVEIKPIIDVIASRSADVDFLHMLLRGVLIESYERLYNGSRGIRLSAMN